MINAMPNIDEFCIYRIMPPITAISVSIIIVRVAPEIASRTFEASVKRETISPTFLLPKKFIGSFNT